MAGLLGDGQKFKRRDKDDKVGGGGRGGRGDCYFLPAMYVSVRQVS